MGREQRQRQWLEGAILGNETAVGDVKYTIIGVSAKNAEEMIQGERFSESMGAVNVSQAFLALNEGLQVIKDASLKYRQ